MAVMQKMNIATGESNEISLLDANGGVLRELIELPPDRFNTNSLCAITEYINKNVNPVDATSGRRYIIHVDSPTKVILKREQNGIKNVHELVLCEAIGVKFPFNQYIFPEDFLIKLQTSFENDDKGNRNNLIAIASNIPIRWKMGLWTMVSPRPLP